MNLPLNSKKNPSFVETHVVDMNPKGRPVSKLFSNNSNQALKTQQISVDPLLDKENVYHRGCLRNQSLGLVTANHKLSVRTESESNRLDGSKCARGDADALKLRNATRHSLAFPFPKSSSKVTSNDKIVTCRLAQVDTCEISSSKQKPVIAFDVVRATFAETSNLESILSELRSSDHPCSEGHLPSMDYFLRIIAHERFREDKACFQIGDFLSCQSHQITSDMLVTLADWMVEIQGSFSLSSSSLHLAWGLLYAFFDKASRIQRTEVQLYASVAFVVACKLEELDSPEIEDFVYLTSNVYSHEQLVVAEQELLISIDFNLHRPNPFFFLRCFYRILDSQSVQLDCMCRFLLDVGLHDHEVSLARASKRAAAVLWLARCVLRNPSYSRWRKTSRIADLYNLILSDERFRNFYTSSGESPRQNDHRFSKSFFPVEAPIMPACFLRSVSEPLHPVEGISTTKEQQSQEIQVRKTINELREMEKLRCPLWPSLLQHVTGYKEEEVVPLALRYHRCALQLLAEAARGERLQAGSEEPEPSTQENGIEIKEEARAEESSTKPTPSSRQSRPCLAVSRSSNERTTSPGGHNIRRHVISKYHRTCYMSVAETYLRCSLENLIPHFPELQCPDLCSCFVCVNLLNSKLTPPQDIQT